MLSTQTITTIQSTVPLLETHGRDITDVFYRTLFAKHSFLKNIFNMANQGKGEQSQALSDAVIAYAKHIDNVSVLLPVVERIAHKHVSLGVKPNHYAVVGETLLSAIQSVLDLPDDHAALLAWGEAYQLLADVFINAESALYDSNAQQTGGWSGYRGFYIDKIVSETPEVKSFYLSPLDLGELPSLKGGQYVGVKVTPKNSSFEQIRQYSLSSYKEMRLTIKAEDQGVVSQHMHACQPGDVINLHAPTGVFTLSKQQPKHVFIAGGVGITPLMSMMEEALATGVNANDILFIQCAKTAQDQIFKDELSTLQHTHPIHVKRCFEVGDDGDHEGYLTGSVLSDWTQALSINPTNAQVYFCGPKPFMGALHKVCTDMGFPDEAIHYEVFGPTTALQ